MVEETEILQLYEVQYSDLKLISSDTESSSLTTQQNQRLESIKKTIMEALGHRGPGLLSVVNVPNASTLRHKLLPLARKLALLNPNQRKHILKEHNLGSDVPLKNPDRKVSSFAMQLRYEQGLVQEADKEFQDNDYNHLGTTFKELGHCMMEIGLCLARVCDKAIGGEELEKCLIESGTAKGRLIHYHSILDKQHGQVRNRFCDSEDTKSNNGVEFYAKSSNLWQQWHYDYGVFTVLTDPLFIFNDGEERFCSCSPSGHTYLQIFNPSENKIQMVKSSSPESFIIQVGESADVLSKGKLRSTLHAVCRPTEIEHLSRETFVVFLQPAWNRTFDISEEYPLNENHHVEQDSRLVGEIGKIVPPLSLRLKNGMTFAEFSRVTTKLYYGDGGLQSNTNR